MIVKGLSIITSLCVLLFLGAVGMQKLVKISDAPQQEEKIARYEQMDSVDETRKGVESSEMLNEIREKAENMILGAKKIAAKLKRVYKDTKIKHTPGGAAGGGPGWEISFTDKEDNPAKVLKALQKTGYDDGDMNVDDIEPYAEGFEKKKIRT